MKKQDEVIKEAIAKLNATFNPGSARIVVGKFLIEDGGAFSVNELEATLGLPKAAIRSALYRLEGSFPFTHDNSSGALRHAIVLVPDRQVQNKTDTRTTLLNSVFC
ncbi:hypothetical protein CSW98_01325 [Vibrio sp. HA2012]|uniref:hypothetical protein n=1 Tax=Vibrio sp. HA2012 TaxID=1971595 RepID=UPI000C2C1F25|nr:hypothetical protein [Vibrio sp. HA2012]PJC87796.1 hypothetical protein CSW98_01325 [Vibrio sp. HA2012]